MKKYCKLLLGILCIIFVLCVSGCNVRRENAEDLDLLEWTQTTQKILHGKLRTEYDTTVYKDITYFFESASMEIQEKEEYIKRMTAFIDALEGFSGQDNGQLNLYIGNNITTVCMPGELYVHTDDINSLQTFLKVFLSTYEANNDAGLAYGITVHAYEDAEDDEIEGSRTEAELAAYFSNAENSYLLDFTLPMLENSFFDEETVSYVQAAAISFTEYCIEEYGKQKTYEMCTDISDEGCKKLVHVKNEWLQKIGTTEKYEEYAKLPFTYNGSKKVEEYPYVLSEENANWYLSPTDVNDFGYTTFVEEYLKTAPVADVDFEQAKEVLEGYYPEDIPAVDIFTAFYNDGGNFTAIYDSTPKIMWIYSDWSMIKHDLLHEYIHYLTLGTDKIFKRNSGLLEGATEEIAVMECDNKLLKMYWQETMSNADKELAKSFGVLDKETGDVHTDILYYYWSKCFYEGNVTKPYMSLGLYMMDYPEEMSWSALSYYVGASMTEYLVEQYGKDKVYEKCLDFWRIEELCGKDFDEFYDEWGAWNEQKYRELKID